MSILHCTHLPRVHEFAPKCPVQVLAGGSCVSTIVSVLSPHACVLLLLLLLLLLPLLGRSQMHDSIWFSHTTSHDPHMRSTLRYERKIINVYGSAIPVERAFVLLLLLRRHFTDQQVRSIVLKVYAWRVPVHAANACLAL